MKTKEEIFLESKGLKDTLYDVNSVIPNTWTKGGLSALLKEYALQESEREAKEFAGFLSDYVLTVSEIEDFNKNDKHLKTRLSNQFFFNYRDQIWATDNDELYQQFKNKEK